LLLELKELLPEYEADVNYFGVYMVIMLRKVRKYFTPES
jgi:hypothetical protein